MHKPSSKQALTLLITLAMVFSALAVLSFAAQPAYGQPLQSFTLIPNTVLSKTLSSSGSELSVASSSVSFASGGTLYYEWSSTGTWSGTGGVWYSLLPGQTSIVGAFTPALVESSGTYYFLVSASSDGSTGVYASNPITVVSTAPTISLSAASGAVGSSVTVTGTGYTAGATVNIYFTSSTAVGSTLPAAVATTTAASNGQIKVSFNVPASPAGTDYVLAIATFSGTSVYGYSGTSPDEVPYVEFTVLPKVVFSPTSIIAENSFTITGTGFGAGDTITAADIVGSSISITGMTITSPASGTITVASDGSFTATVSTAGATFGSPGYGQSTVTVTDSGSHSASATLTILRPSISVSPSSIIPGQSFTVTGTDFGPGSVIAANSITVGGATAANNAVTVSSSGSFTVTVSTASITDFTALGSNTVSVTASQTGLSQTATTSIVLLAPSITVSPSSIIPGGSFTVTGADFYPGSTIAANSITVGTATVTNSAVTVSSSGTFTVTVSTSSFTGTLVSGTDTVTVNALLPSGVKIASNGYEAGTATLSVGTPTISIVYPSGYYSLAPGQNVTIIASNFFPGATIAADTITYDSVQGTNPAITVPSTGSFTTWFVLPSGITASGIFALTVTETAPNSLTLSPPSASVYAILSSPTLSAMNIYVAASASSAPSTSLASQTVGATVYYYLFGYPASSTLSLTMGGVTVATGIMTDPNGAYFGTFDVPALPGSTTGVSYTVQTQSAYGLQAQTPSTVSVVPSFTISGTESYFINYGYLASGDYFNITGTGFNAFATVTLTSSPASQVSFVASSVMTNSTGSFVAEAQVIATSLTTNTLVDLTVSTTSASYDYHAETGTYPFHELGTPTLTLTDTSTLTNIGTTGDTVTVTASNLISYSATGVSYTVSGSLGATLSGLTDTANSGTITVTSTTNGTVVETLAANAPGLPEATAIFLVSIPGSTGYLVNASNGKAVTAAPGGTFKVYAVGFSSSDVALSATDSLSLTGGTSTATSDGAVIFTITIPSTALLGTYLIYAEGTSPSYTTSVADSIVLTVEPTFALSSTTVASGGALTISSAYGYTPNTYYSVYFGDGIHNGQNIGTALASSTGALSFVGTVNIPAVNAGTYYVGIATYTSANTISIGTVIAATLTPITVTSNVVWTPDPYAFPGELVSFAYTTGVLNPAPVGPVSMQVLLDGSAYVTVPVTESGTGTGTTYSGSFTMFNGMVNSSYSIELVPQYQAETTVTQPYSATDVIDFTSASTPASEVFTFTVPSGVSISTSSSTVYLTDLASGSTTEVSGAVAFTTPTVTVTIPAADQSASTAYAATISLVGTIQVEQLQTTTGTPSDPATITLISGNGALLTGVSSTQIAEIVANVTGAVKTAMSVPLSELNASVVAINGAVAQLKTAFGNMTASLNAINATVVSIMNGQAEVMTDLGTVQTSLASLNASVASVQGSLVTLNTAVGQLTTSLSNLNATVMSISSGVANLQTAVGNIQVSLNAINASLMGIQNGVAVLNTSLGQVKTSLASIAGQITAVNGSVATVETSLGTLQTSLSNLNATVTSISGNVATVQTSLGTLSGTVTNISNGVATIQTSLGTLQTSVSGVNSKVSSVSSSVGSTILFEVVVLVLVLITLVLAFLAMNNSNRLAKKLDEMKKQ